jgi:hypothetical protein
MFARCPPLLLVEEIELLQPIAVILLGRAPNPRDSVRPLLNVQWGEHPGHLERDTFRLRSGQDIELFSCNHPSTKNRESWRASLGELIDSVRERSVGDVA